MAPIFTSLSNVQIQTETLPALGPDRQSYFGRWLLYFVFG